MKRRRRREIEVFSMSFLDVISCGFGALVLLLILALAFDPVTTVTTTQELRKQISETDVRREHLVRENMELAHDLAAKEKALSALSNRLETLNASWKEIQVQQRLAQARLQEQVRVKEQLSLVQQNLSDEMKRLLGRREYRAPREETTIGGLPVDSEYIIFVIDTSGSMTKGAWPLVVKKMQEILDSYPNVKGLQVLNDEGYYMFPTYRGQWIPDTPARRAIVIDRLKSWVSFSDSSPVEGIVAAIRTFYRPDRPTSIFVFGDDFNGKSIEDVVQLVRQVNRKDAAGRTQMRIHTLGFPVLPLLAKEVVGFARFAHLMRVLAEENSGSFVGLNSLQ